MPPRKCCKCGEELEWVDCYNCDEGYSGHDCGEDTCCCADPEPNVVCDICHGEGGFLICPNTENHQKEVND